MMSYLVDKSIINQIYQYIQKVLKTRSYLMMVFSYIYVSLLEEQCSQFSKRLLFLRLPKGVLSTQQRVDLSIFMRKCTE